MLVPKASQRSRGTSARFHVWKGTIPTEALSRLEESLFVSKPEFILLQMAGWHSKISPVSKAFAQELQAEREARAVAHNDDPVPFDDPFAWEQSARQVGLVLAAMELMGTYRLAAPGGKTRYHQRALLTSSNMERFLEDIPHVYGRNRLDTALRLALPHSASPMETALALLLSLPEAYGGYGLPRPRLNRKKLVDNHEQLWSGGPSITPDLLWEDARLVIEYDSDEMHGGVGARKLASDATRANVLSARGYTVLRVTTLNIQSSADMERLARQVANHLGIDLTQPSDALRIRRNKLHALLMQQ